MKKFLAFTVGIVMFCSLALFTACGEENIGKMSGNFKKEATAEEFSAATVQIQNAVDQNTILGGDTESENWAFGFDSRAKFTVKTTAGGESTSVKLNAGYKIALRNSKEGEEIQTSVAGAGDISVKTSGDKSEDLSLTFYNDTDYIYIDFSSVQEGMKIKMQLEDLVGMLSGAMDSGAGTMSVADNTGTGESSESGSVQSGDDFSVLAETGCKIYIDDSKGLKIKISATAQTLTTLLTELGGLFEGILPYQISSVAKCDLYFALDEEGKLAQISADIDLTIGGAAAEGETDAAGITLKGGFYLKAYSGDVEFPDDLSTYTDGMLPGLFA